MPTLVQIIIASIVVSSISLIGVVVLVLKRTRLVWFNLVLIALAAGTMMGGAFFHLIPESLKILPARLVGLLVVVGFLVFFILEKLLHWHHCQPDESSHVDDTHTSSSASDHISSHTSGQSARKLKSLGYLNLTADLLHNFIDGVVIASAFMVSPQVGWATTLAVAMHEIPQELGDFGVLLHAGFSSTKAMLLNFLTAWSALLGALLGFIFLKDSTLSAYILPLTAGGFIYIAASDLIPEIKHQVKLELALGLTAMFVAGLGIMWLL